MWKWNESIVIHVSASHEIKQTPHTGPWTAQHTHREVFLLECKVVSAAIFLLAENSCCWN